MIRIANVKAEPLNFYDRPQKVVITVLTAASVIYVGTDRYHLGQTINGVVVGTPITTADGKIAVDVVGDIYWAAGADGVQADVLETGAL